MPIPLPNLRQSWSRHSIYRLLPWPILTVATVIFLNDNLLEVMSVRGRSMAPSLSPLYDETAQMDHLLFRKFSPAGNLKRGDVVSFLAPHKSDHLVVKRVVALEGDTVFLDPRRRSRDEGPVGEKRRRDWDVMGHWDWESAERRKGMAAGPPAVKVPYGHVWIEGDNWRESLDSNTYGPLSKSLIVGKAVVTVLPLAKFGDRSWKANIGRTKVRPGEVVIPPEWQDP